MRESFKKRLDKIEESTFKTKPMLLSCASDQDLEEIIAEWEASKGAPSQDKPLIIIRTS